VRNFVWNPLSEQVNPFRFSQIVAAVTLRSLYGRQERKSNNISMGFDLDLVHQVGIFEMSGLGHVSVPIPSTTFYFLMYLIHIS
jgi:hypothetical protein